MSGTKTAGPPSDLMAPFLLLLVLLAEAASASDKPVVTVHPGNDVTLPCRSNDPSISTVKWSRPDLTNNYVFFYIRGKTETTKQHKSFKDRVELVDRDLTNGNVSLTLKNVSRHDTGTYECRVKNGDSRRTKRDNSYAVIINTVYLQVTGSDSGSSKHENPKNDVPEDGPSSPGGRHHGLVVGAAGGLLLVAAAVAGVLMYKRHKDKRSGLPAADEASGEKLV